MHLPDAPARSSRWLLAGLASLALLKVACDGGKDGDEPNVVVETLAAALADVGPYVVRPALDRAAAAADTLVIAAEAWEAAEASGTGGAEAQAAAQAAWWGLMEAWQEVEVLQIGPAASSLTAAGGADLRDSVYSWPTVNRCRVDQETVEAAWDDADFFSTNLVNVYGLAALEVLLYAPAGENVCAATVGINTDGSWAALGVEGVQRNRASYARALATHTASMADDLVSRWDPAGGDFGAQLANAGDASVYETPEQALNAVFDALFYLETSTKDRKLGYAVGAGDCVETSCIASIESPIAGGSHAWVKVNLRAFRTLYLGGEGTGMDDVVRSLGEEALADALLVALDEADAAAAAVTTPYDVAMTNDRAPMDALYAAVKAVTDLLKGDIATVLLLQIPSEASGDND
ncbi:MAG: imelysin family protein [Pseudomonadota bacterium]|nr:imelysin family protein [Pseudomonadota bacterium]